jgi:hypothetical protein
MELTSEDAALLIASENVHLKLKRERSGVHEINQLRGHYGEYHHFFSHLKADGERFFQYLCRLCLLSQIASLRNTLMIIVSVFIVIRVNMYV